MQAVPVGQHGVDERTTDVDPATRALQHALDQLGHLGRGQDQVGQLVAPAPGDEDPAGVVDPDLLDLGVVEERLQRSEAGNSGHQLTDDSDRVG
ncbi:MAG: hypothetical protein WBR13_14380, partial [Allosphingosinicella sp.]